MTLLVLATEVPRISKCYALFDRNYGHLCTVLPANSQATIEGYTFARGYMDFATFTVHITSIY